MIFQSVTQSSMGTVNIRQQVYKQKRRSLSCRTAMWKSFGKMTVGVIAGLICFTFLMGAIAARNEEMISKVKVVHHDLIDVNIVLRAEKAELFSKEHIRLAAEQKLSLIALNENQKYTFKR